MTEQIAYWVVVTDDKGGYHVMLLAPGTMRYETRPAADAVAVRLRTARDIAIAQAVGARIDSRTDIKEAS